MMTLSELQLKDVITVEEGKKLGHISDLEIDVDKGIILYLVVSLKGKMMGFFGKEEELTIPWNHILTIGSDVILVKKVEKPKLFTEENREY